MKIDQPGDVKSLYPTQGQAPKRKTDAASEGRSAPTEQVAINPLASQVDAVSRNIIAGGASFDPDKVAAIKNAIASGHFQVNPENIADGLIDSVRELLVK